MTEVLITIRGRLTAFTEALLQDSHISKPFQPVLKNLIKNFLENVTDQELREGIEGVRDKIIPYILEGTVSDEDKPPQ